MQDRIEKLIQLENPLRKIKLRTLFPCVVEYLCCCCVTENTTKQEEPNQEKDVHVEVFDDESQVKNDESTSKQSTSSFSSSFRRTFTKTFLDYSQDEKLENEVKELQESQKKLLAKLQTATKKLKHKEDVIKYEDLCEELYPLVNGTVEGKGVKHKRNNSYKKSTSMRNQKTKRGSDDLMQSIEEENVEAQNYCNEEPAAKETEKKENLEEKHPFLKYGVAIENFFELEKWLIWTFLILTLMAIPQMTVFAVYNGLYQGYHEHFLARLSFGSLGQADVECSQSVVLGSTDQLNFLFSCDKDYQTKNVYNLGIIDPLDLDKKNAQGSVCSSMKSD